MRTALLIFLWSATSVLWAQPLSRAQISANVEHMKNFSAYFQLKKYSEAIAESEKMNGRPEMPLHLLPDLAVAYDQINKPVKAMEALGRIREKSKDSPQSGGLLIAVTKLEDNGAKLKHAGVKAEISKLIKELPQREKLLEETIAKARKNPPR